jgi:hypothetical protein
MTSDKEKIRVYESLLHRIQLYAEVTMDNERLSKLISNICRWSYAHRAGNGTFTEDQQNEYIEKEFHKLLEG